MKIKLPLIISALLGFTLFSCDLKEQPEAKTAPASFAELGNREDFVEQHDEPIAIKHEGKHGKMIEIAVEGGAAANAYFIEHTEETNRYLFIIHEWWGLNDHIKREAEKWHEELGNVHVMALDLYDGKVATNRVKAREYMQGASEERILSIITAAIDRLPENAELGTIGWCFGGGWSLRTALKAGDKTKACVMYYGMPVEDVEQLSKLNSDVLFIYGTKDRWINEGVASKFEKNMKEADRPLKVLSFDADHAFANPSSEHYIEKAALEANRSTFTYLSERFDGN